MEDTGLMYEKHEGKEEIQIGILNKECNYQLFSTLAFCFGGLGSKI
jgi:hypothetical protein